MARYGKSLISVFQEFFLLVFIEFLFWLGDWVYRGPKYISTNRFQIHSTFHAPSVTLTVFFRIAGYHY